MRRERTTTLQVPRSRGTQQVLHDPRGLSQRPPHPVRHRLPGTAEGVPRPGLETRRHMLRHCHDAGRCAGGVLPLWSRHSFVNKINHSVILYGNHYLLTYAFHPQWDTRLRQYFSTGSCPSLLPSPRSTRATSILAPPLLYSAMLSLVVLASFFRVVST